MILRAFALVLAASAAAQEASTPPDAAPASPVRGLRINEAAAFDGFTLFAPIRSGKTFLVDMEGKEVHVWENPHGPLSVYLMDDGSLLRASRIDENPTFHGGGLGGRIQELAPDGRVTWEFVLSDAENTLHHDFRPLSNGHILAIAWERLTKDEALALGRDPAELSEDGLWPDWVLEIEPTRPSGGRIVWEWHGKDHLIQDFDASKAGYGSIPEHPERIDVNADHRDEPPMTEEERREREQREAEMRALGYAGGDEGEEPDGARPGDDERPGDWWHSNSIDFHPGLDLILLSTPRLNEVWIIDHSTTTEEARGSTGGRWKRGGDLLYRWGNPRTYGAGTDTEQQLFAQHQPEWVRAGLPGAGHVTVFNNGRERPGEDYSSIEELELPFDPARGFLREPGQAFGPAKPLWTYADAGNFFSHFISGCQRLANGNTFICSGKQGRFFEVTPQGAIVWEYWNPHGGELAFPNPRRRPGSQPGGPPADDGPPGGGPPGGGPPGDGNPVEPTSCFRATRIAPDHPGLKALGLR